MKALTKAIAEWSLAETVKELCAKGTPPPIPAGWFTSHQLADEVRKQGLSHSPTSVRRLLAKARESGNLEEARHPVRRGRHVVPVPIYRLAKRRK